MVINTTFHDKFLIYLETIHTFNEKKRNKLIEFAEEQIPAYLQTNGFPDICDLYCKLDSICWDDIILDGLPISTDEEREYAHMVMESIKYIKGFIKFDKTADYKKLFTNKVKKEQKKAAAQINEDNSLPEAEDNPRKEGAVTQVSVTQYERNPEDRKKALERDNYECQVCHMKFVDTYGEIGKAFIEVHHLYPVCNMGENYKFDPLDPEKGLVCLCSNCHSMIHRGGHYETIDGERKMVPMTLKDLQDLYNKNNNTD